MRDEDILNGSPIEDSWLTLEQLAAACTVEPVWLRRHLDEGLIPRAESVAGVWWQQRSELMPRCCCLFAGRS
jgi:chaperone modulatory protein CbpM